MENVLAVNFAEDSEAHEELKDKLHRHPRAVGTA
jgi:hypothetical protein